MSPPPPLLLPQHGVEHTGMPGSSCGSFQTQLLTHGKQAFLPTEPSRRPYLVLLEDHTKSKNTSPWNSLESLSLWSRSPYVLIQSWVLSLCIFLSLHKDSGFLTITKEPARSPLCSGLSLDINWPPMREFILGPLPRSARPFLGLFAPACGIF